MSASKRTQKRRFQGHKPLNSEARPTYRVHRGSDVFELPVSADTTFEQWWDELLKVLLPRGYPAPRALAEMAWLAGKQVGLDINY